LIKRKETKTHLDLGDQEPGDKVRNLTGVFWGSLATLMQTDLKNVLSTVGERGRRKGVGRGMFENGGKQPGSSSRYQKRKENV